MNRPKTLMSLQHYPFSSKWGYRVITLGVLLYFWAALTCGAHQLSFTADEPAYIAGGYALWSQGAAAFDLLSQRGYPPLLPLLEASLM